MVVSKSARKALGLPLHTKSHERSAVTDMRREFLSLRRSFEGPWVNARRKHRRQLAS